MPGRDGTLQLVDCSNWLGGKAKPLKAPKKADKDLDEVRVSRN